MLPLVIVLSLPVSYAIHSVACLTSNYLTAQKLGLPILIVPLTWQNAFWLFLEPYMSPILASHWLELTR
jgi:hypothetical protein